MSFVTTAYCQTDSPVTSDTVAAAQQDTSDAAFQLWIKEIFDGIFAQPKLDSLKQVSQKNRRCNTCTFTQTGQSETGLC